MPAKGPRTSWNIQGKVLHIGVEAGVQSHTFKITSATPADQKAAAFRAIADLLDPDFERFHEPSRSVQRRVALQEAPELPRQIAVPYPALDPGSQDAAPQEAAEGFLEQSLEHSHGVLPDGTPIRTPLPSDPAEAASHARLAQKARQLGIDNVKELKGLGGLEADDLPLIEARPRAERNKGLHSQGLEFLPPTALPRDQVRERPDPFDPAFHFKDTR